MNALEPQAIQLADYRPPDFRILTTDLTFELGDDSTLVTNRMRIERISESTADRIRFDGQSLKLESVAVDGRTLGGNEYKLDEDSLTLENLPAQCEVTVMTRIQPAENTALEGLYESSGMYCTQCEAEGFRKITYYQDRPDVLSVFTTTIVADERYPVMLSNGNLVAEQTLGDGRRQVVWHDPHPKPSYLFALVAGDLALTEDSFTTVSGRTVVLRIYSEPHNIAQCGYAMDVLKRSMRWDEQVYGREYDLDIFMIVAVDDFNMGAMENKGLNIFNTSCVLASPDTATDQSYLRVEAVVAHEYFHNWSGNRVTCRDWFQLSLKEGFTVFRDAEFSADMNSRTVKRIEDVTLLRSVQFAEDSGPLAHPIRPDSYIEISNFYTPTVYEKGAEVVRMVHTLLGPEAFRTGSDLYFERHDGQAVTTDDFLSAMADASGQDLGQFQRWYGQAGTPVVTVSSDFENGALTLRLAQSCPPTPGQPEKQTLHIPLLMGLIAASGQPIVGDALAIECDARVEVRGETLLVHLRTPTLTIRFTGLDAPPEVSILRGFSAPVRIDWQRGVESLSFLARSDPDGFAAWDALQSVLVAEVARLGEPDVEADASDEVVGLFDELLTRTLEEGGANATAEQNFLFAEKLAVPDENYLFEQFDRVDVDRLCRGRDRLLRALGVGFSGRWQALLEANASNAPFTPHTHAMSMRALKQRALQFVGESLDAQALEALLKALYEQADNLTDRRAVLAVGVNREGHSSVVDGLLADFLERWRDEALVVNQWFSVQAVGRNCSAETLGKLLAHEAFTIRNPNKVRATLGSFAQRNQRNFHAVDGTGYELVGDKVIELDGINPQMASALAKPLTRWRRFLGERPLQMQRALQRIADREALSTDVFEVVSKSLPG